MTTEHPPESEKYYTDNEVAGLLGISLGRLRNKLSAGQPLPPRIQPVWSKNSCGYLQGLHCTFSVTE